MADVAMELGETYNVDVGSANTVRRLVPPTNARRLRIVSRTNASKLVVQTADGEITLADGDALSSTPYTTLPANTPMEIDVPNAGDRSRQLVEGRRYVWVASATANTIVEITPF